MDMRLAVAMARRVDGERLNVTALARELGICRETFYVYERRFREEGMVGLLGRSRAPHRHPNQTPVEVEDRIGYWYSKLRGEGLDFGARSIWAWMSRAGEGPPSPRTVHRILVRRGLVRPQPQKRPRSSFRSFRAERPNGIWQIDGMKWQLADAREVTIIRVLDDHARQIMGSVVAAEESAEAAWACLEKAMGKHGPPAMFLSDNSLAFNGSRRGAIVLVERNLRTLGVAVVASTAHHPQTCGKAEREHQTLGRWLRAQPPADDVEELERLLEVYEEIYNVQRPHQALGDGLQTPAEAYAATAKAVPAGAPLPVKPRITRIKVSAHGEVSAGADVRIQVGRGWEGVTLTVVRDGNSVALFDGNQLVENRIIDPTRRYQPSGRKPPGGGRRLPRHAGAQHADPPQEGGVKMERPQRSEDERP